MFTSHPENVYNPEDEQSTGYCGTLGISANKLDGDSRVCPETGETWWADMPPYFLFGESEFMVHVESEKIKEDLAKG
jgi:hypothetical protein